MGGGTHGWVKRWTDGHMDKLKKGIKGSQGMRKKEEKEKYETVKYYEEQ